MASHDYPAGNYVVIDKETYDRAAYGTMRVKDNKIVTVEEANKYRVRLVKSRRGFAVARGNANLLLNKNETYPDIEFYDFDPERNR